MWIAGRFEVEHEAGAGGMGVVYRARDRETGDRVAVKLLRADTPDGSARFLREANALASLSHPAIVRHVAHGVLEDARPWLAMEWLDGEDLAKRLKRGAIAPSVALAIVRRAADAIAEAHDLALVHRDIKPANLFLVDGDPAKLKVLDFGIARLDRAEHTPTATGEMLGTPGYLAPEQARGDRTVDGRADVFSLGCVLFECLTGQPAFSGAQVMAILAKILLEDVHRVSDLVEGAPPPLDALVDRMLARDRVGRPKDARALIEALDAVAPLVGDVPLRPAAPRAGISQAERRRVVLALFTPMGDGDRETDPSAARERASEIARGADVRVEALGGGAFVVLVSGLESATELATRGARVALALRDRLPRMHVHLATSTAVLDDPIADVVDRAVRAARDDAAREVAHAPIHLDEAIVALLGDRFDVEQTAHGAALWGVRDESSDTHPTAGAPTMRTVPSPCVGRERELAVLLAAYESALDTEAPSLSVVTAPAGAGKSRLRLELAARLRDRPTPPRAWTVLSDPMEAGVPLAVAARLVRSAASIERDDGSIGRAKLGAHLSAIACDDAARVAEILGEIALGASPTPSAWLAAIRDEPAAMRDQIARAWIAWLDAEVRRGVVVLLLEDLHWTDLATLKLLDLALRELGERAWATFAFARPEVAAHLPRSWAERGLSEIRLGPLPRKAAEEIARRAMGRGATDAAVRSVVARAGGNAFLVEQLAMRAMAERDTPDSELPDSVLAVVQARFEGLSADARRVLRAGSVLGERFWVDAVGRLLGGVAPRVVEGWLDEIVGKGLVERAEGGHTRFAGHPEIRFHHALVRDAALATLTAEDRTLAHGLAASWLESVGEKDVLVVARHHERGGAADRASVAYAAAARRAIASEDLAGAAEHASRAIELGLPQDRVADAWLTIADARAWLGDNAGWQRAAEEAASCAVRGSDAWWLAMRHLVTITGRKRDRDALVAWSASIADAPMDRPEIAARTLAAAASSSFGLDARREGWAFVARAESLEIEGAAHAIAHAEIAMARGLGHREEHDHTRARAILLDAASALEAAGDVAQACRARIHAAAAAAETNTIREAIDELRAVVTRTGDRLPRLRWAARTVLADVLRRSGDLGGSEAEARIALEEATAANEDLGALAARATTALLAMKRDSS